MFDLELVSFKFPTWQLLKNMITANHVLFLCNTLEKNPHSLKKKKKSPPCTVVNKKVTCSACLTFGQHALSFMNWPDRQNMRILILLQPKQELQTLSGGCFTSKRTTQCHSFSAEGERKYFSNILKYFQYC